MGKNEIRQGFCIENLSGCTERNDADYSTGIHPDYLEDCRRSPDTWKLIQDITRWSRNVSIHRKKTTKIIIKWTRQEETVFEILSKSACWSSQPPPRRDGVKKCMLILPPPAQEGRGQKVHADPPRLRGSLIHGGWEDQQGWFLVGNNLLTSRPPIHSIITYQSW